MIRQLKRNLFLLLAGSLTMVFTAVFLLMICLEIKQKQQSSIAYLNRMVTMLIFSMEQDSDYMEILTLYEQSLDYSFRLFSDTDSLLYQSSEPENCQNIMDSFLKTLQHYQYNSYAVNPDRLNSLSKSCQSAAFAVHMPDRRQYDCVYCEIVANNGEKYGLCVARPASSPAEFLLSHLDGYLFIWAGVFLVFLALSFLLTRITVKPAENASLSQKNFIAAVSHECKSPLAAILSSAEMIGSLPDICESAQPHLTVIDQEVSRMSRLIQDLLLLSSLDAGSWSLCPERIDVDTLMIALYTKYEPVCKKENITLKLDLTEENYPTVFSDADRLDQIISTLLDNAVSYSPPSSEILLGASVEKNELIITVTDHGAGISDKDKPYVFDRFYRCDQARTRRDHFGLGLSIAKELTEKLGGRIQLSDTCGGGCTFRVFLPV